MKLQIYQTCKTGQLNLGGEEGILNDDPKCELPGTNEENIDRIFDMMMDDRRFTTYIYICVCVCVCMCVCVWLIKYTYLHINMATLTFHIYTLASIETYIYIYLFFLNIHPQLPKIFYLLKTLPVGLLKTLRKRGSAYFSFHCFNTK